MIGTKLSDRYEVFAELGRGGMGVVYRARDPLLNREVAVKLVPPTLLNPDNEQRFQREAQMVAQMDHPAIVPIFDFGRHMGSLFFVMPVVQGTNLRAYLRERALLGEILDVGIQVAEALEYSHARGVIHRDIKPENIMVSRDEAGGVRVRVMDFGLARASAETRLTKSGALVGTLSYLCPEQVAGTEADGRSDVYSLGTVLYECVVGEPPFSGEMQSILYRILHEHPQPPRSAGADIDDELEQAILACLAKDPAQRPQRAGELAEILERYRSKLRDSDRERSVAGLTQTFLGARPALSPFVGRAREFAELQMRLNAAVAGECQFVVLGGEPGIGKTRLLDELETLARARRIRVLHGRVVEQDGAFPYQGFCEAIQDYYRSRDTSSSSVPDLSDLAPDLVALFPMLSEIGEIRSAATDARPAREGAPGPESRTRVFELLARTITRVGGGKPLVLLLEDLHGATVSIEAVQYIVRRLGPTPILIVGTFRTTEVDSRHPVIRMLDGFAGDRHFASLSLGAFSPSDHRTFLQTLVGGPELAQGLVQKLYDGTEGNPFFTKELVRSLLDSGGIARDDSGAWTLSAEAAFSADALPATIQQAVEKRVERLPDALRDILSVAAVIGKTFDARDLEALLEGSADVEASLDRLVEEGLIEEERESRGDLLTFSSKVVRDVLYAGLSRRRRRSLHRRYAERLETRHKGRLERVLPPLVYHFSQGDVPEKTVEHGLRLARSALESFSPEEAARSARTALEFLDEEWEGDRVLEGEARMLLARALRLSSETEGALKEAEAAFRIFDREGHPDRALGSLLLAAETAWQGRRTEEAGRYVERGLAAARAAGETEGIRQLLSLAATLANLQGEYEKANVCLEEAARLATGPGEVERDEAIPRGGRLVVALANPAHALEPASIQTLEEEEVLANVFETLLASDRAGNLVPALCERWEGQDGRTFLFTLRENATFQDGHPLRAADVKRSFERTIRQVSREMPAAFAALRGLREFAAGEAEGVAGIVVSSEVRLELQLREPLPIYPALLAHLRTAIVRATPGHVWGTGPFRLASHEGDRIVLERHPHYWRGAASALDAIEFRSGLRSSTIASGLRGGEVDVGGDLLPDDLDDLLKDARFRRGLAETARNNTYLVVFNTTGPVAREASVRRAVAGVVRTRDVVWQTLGRFAQPAVCLIPPGMLGHDPGRRRRPLSRDEAAQILGSAGGERPLRLKASVHPLFLDRYGSLLSALLAAWSEIGVEVSIATPTLDSYLGCFQDNAGIDLMIGRWNADYADPDNFTHGLFHSQAGLWRHYFSSPDADRILEEARAETRPGARETLYRKFEDLLLESGVLVTLFHDIEYRLVSPKVRGLKLRSSPPYVNYAELGKVEDAAPAADARREGGTIEIPMAGVVTSLDPAAAVTADFSEVLSVAYETLTRDVGAARIVPWLAAEFRPEDGGRRYRFRLRDDVRFHDGRRLTARDVRYSLERLLQRGDSQNRWLLSPIRGAKALIGGQAADLAGFRIESAAEFTLELEEPVSFFPVLLTYSSASIVPEGYDRPGAGWQDGNVGTGPFRVVRFDPGRRLEVERNPTYWRRGYPRSESLAFSFGVSPKEIAAGFRAGRFSVAGDLYPADVEALRREPDFAASYKETPRLVTYYAAFNTRRGPLSDPRLRRSLVASLDVPLLVRQTIGRLAIPAQGLIPPGLIGHGTSHWTRGPAGGPSTGEPTPRAELTAAVHPIFWGGYSDLGRELWGTLRAKGVTVRPKETSSTEYAEAALSATVDVLLGRWVADYPDADTFVQHLHSREGFLGPLCGSAEIDRLVERGRSEASPLGRHALYRQVEQILARDAILLPLFHDQAYRFARPEVEGLSVSFWLPTVAYESLHVRT